MTAPVYNQIPDAPRLYVLDGVAQAQLSVADFWAGYCAGAHASFGAQAGIEQVWDDAGGVYLFLGETPTDFAGFLADLLALLPALSPTGNIRMLWISNPVSSPWGYWRTQTLDAVATGTATPLTWLVARQTCFSLGNYSIMIQGGTSLNLANSDQTGYGALIEDSGFCFYAPGCSYPAQSGSMMLFAGTQAGAFVSNLLLGNENGDDMAALGVMLRYAKQDEDSVFGETEVLSMPVLGKESGNIAATLCYDPLNPLVADRSNLCLYRQGTVSTPLSSAFATTMGYSITLAAAAGNAPLRPGRLAFCRTPIFAAESDQDTYFNYHLAPDGAYTLAVVPPSTGSSTQGDNFMFGLSGIEYAPLPASGGSLLFFRTGQAAYVPLLQEESIPALSDFATTAYATLLPTTAEDSGLTYYAQPLQAPLFLGADDLGTGFLDFHPMPSGTLPTYPTSAPTVLPIGAYQWINPEQTEAAQTLEEAILAPLRRQAVGLPAFRETARLADAAIVPAAVNPSLAITPQGLVAKLSDDLLSWAGVVLANMPDSLHNEVELTYVGPIMQAALQSNQLFFVVSNVDNFMEQSSVQYRLTQLDMELLAAEGVPASVIDSLTGAYGPLPSSLYATETAFLAVYPTDAESLNYQSQVLAVAGVLETDIEGWTFQLSPRSWRTGDTNPTIMLFKYCNRSLEDLVKDANCWGWKEAAWDSDTNQSVLPTQLKLLEIIAYAAKRAEEADEAGDTGDPYAIFYREVASNPMWNGVLFFNAPVDFTQMPDELQFLSAGIDTSQFFAHHLGFSITPFTATGNGIDLQQTAAFGLIAYEDLQDLVADVTIPFGFKTLQLQVRFANAHVADFAAQVELMVNDLFGSVLSKIDAARGNNLIMNGTYQQSGGSPSYLFSLSEQNAFNALNAVLVGVEFLSVRVETGGGENADTILTKFALTGNMRFAYLANFDLYSYGPDTASEIDGYLRFGGLNIVMAFERAAPGIQEFVVNEGAISFDLADSIARASSLVSNFPLVAATVVSSPNLSATGELPSGQTPEDMGFTSISCPLDQTPMTAPWYGLVFNLDLGTIGALAGSAGMSVSLLAAWSQGAASTDMPVYLGLKLPNTPAIGGSIPIQGVLKIGFRSFEFSTYPADDEGSLGYLLTLRRFALSILCWSFPPGNADICLFGATKPNPPNSAIGWYAAYDADPSSVSTAQAEKEVLSVAGKPAIPVNPVQRRLRSGRRTKVAR